jgi:hypothetical protein
MDITLEDAIWNGSIIVNTDNSAKMEKMSDFDSKSTINRISRDNHFM